jgi:hypothetical protein
MRERQRTLLGNLLFIASNNRLSVYDVAEPSRPKRLCSIDGASFQELTTNEFSLRSSAVTYGDGRLFVVIRRNLRDFLGIAQGPFEGAQCGVAVFDVSDWNKPTLLGWYALPQFVSDFTTLVYHKGHVFASDACLWASGL